MAAWLVPLAVALAVAGAWASVHVVTTKRDARGAAAWLWAIWMTPGLGAALYVLLGINRIERRATSLRRRRQRLDVVPADAAVTPASLAERLPAAAAHLAALARVGDSVASRRLVAGNTVAPLRNGEEAYPAMLSAIDGAERSVALLAYIFERDDVGGAFLDALLRARRRGVEVRVLLDAIGSAKDLRRVERELRAGGVRMASFLPVRVLRFARHVGLRNHRKVLVADGRVGFTGGMNVRASHLVARPQPHHEQDVAFRFEGPVVAHLAEVFAEDWAFATGEVLGGSRWFPAPRASGDVVARGVAFDPGERLDTLRCLIVAALATARRSIRVVTPYFLPDQALVSALNVAALRGVEVDIVLPARTDVRLVQWACAAQLWQVLGSGCRTWLTPPPFDHAKLLVVDDAWTLVGSANLDPRSLRLSFELEVECYDPRLALAVGGLVGERIERARRVTLGMMDARSLPVRVRDGAARLLAPFL